VGIDAALTADDGAGNRAFGSVVVVVGAGAGAGAGVGTSLVVGLGAGVGRRPARSALLDSSFSRIYHSALALGIVEIRSAMQVKVWARSASATSGARLAGDCTQKVTRNRQRSIWPVAPLSGVISVVSSRLRHSRSLEFGVWSLEFGVWCGRVVASCILHAHMAPT
jgi:hypothetical protein